MRLARRGWWVLSGGAPPPGVFEEVLVHHLDALYGLAVRLTRDADTAADLLQDTALRAFQKFHQLRQPGAARSWLSRIMTTTFLNRYADRTADDQPDGAEEAVVEETPEAVLLRRCDAEEVESALAELPEEYRFTVLMADLEEMSLREIASIRGCPIGTVASRLARGRRMLRERLRHLKRAGEVDG